MVIQYLNKYLTNNVIDLELVLSNGKSIKSSTSNR